MDVLLWRFRVLKARGELFYVVDACAFFDSLRFPWITVTRAGNKLPLLLPSFHRKSRPVKMDIGVQFSSTQV